MLLSSPRHWRLDYLLIQSEQWQHLDDAHFLRRGFEVLDRWHALRALEEIAMGDRPFFRQLGREVLGSFQIVEPAPRSYEAACQDKQMLEALGRQLGTGLRARP